MRKTKARSSIIWPLMAPIASVENPLGISIFNRGRRSRARFRGAAGYRRNHRYNVYRVAVSPIAHTQGSRRAKGLARLRRALNGKRRVDNRTVPNVFFGVIPIGYFNGIIGGIPTGNPNGMIRHLPSGNPNGIIGACPSKTPGIIGVLPAGNPNGISSFSPGLRREALPRVSRI
jgi:hypothetical protein